MILGRLLYLIYTSLKSKNQLTDYMRTGHPVMIGTWKKEFLEKSKDIFKDPRKKSDDLREKEISLDEAHKTIGQLTVERDWLKKKYAQLGGI
jgi:hypothetical protein